VVLIVDGSGKVEQRQITAERAIGDRWFVSSGLKPGDRVIVEGSQKVRPGAMVKAVPFDGSGKTNAQPAKAAPQQPAKTQ
jgi:membrane fusion protein (multidrug efflux system)